MPLAVSGGLEKTDFRLTTKFNKMQETNNLPQNPSLQQTAVIRRFSNILIEIDGELVQLRDLPKHEYEEFLEVMHRLRLAYISVVSR